MQEAGHGLLNEHFFDTLHISPKTSEELQNIKSRAAEKEINLRYFKDGTVGPHSSSFSLEDGQEDGRIDGWMDGYLDTCLLISSVLHIV